MSVTDIHHGPPAPAPAAEAPIRCEDCGAAVEAEQRYCVNCGAHRRVANDPAARYFSQATARTRATVAVRSARPEPRRGAGMVVGLALAVIPVAVGVGVVVGRSSNNNDDKLISALNHRAAATTVAAAPATTSAATQTSALSAGATSTHTGAHKAKHAKAATHKKTAKKSAHKKTAAASGGETAAQKAGITATATKTKVGGSGSASENAQGAKIVNKLKHTNGTSYLNQLPQQVVVP
jgi:hypothetical protein